MRLALWLLAIGGKTKSSPNPPLTGRSIPNPESDPGGMPPTSSIHDHAGQRTDGQGMAQQRQDNTQRDRAGTEAVR